MYLIQTKRAFLLHMQGDWAFSMFCSFNCRCSLLNILELEFHSAASQLGSKDFFSLPWEEFVLEHNRHHASTVDLLIKGEFGWDPEEFHYALQQWARPFSTNWSAGHIFSIFQLHGFFPCLPGEAPRFSQNIPDLISFSPSPCHAVSCQFPRQSPRQLTIPALRLPDPTPSYVR